MQSVERLSRSAVGAVAARPPAPAARVTALLATWAAAESRPRVVGVALVLRLSHSGRRAMFQHDGPTGRRVPEHPVTRRCPMVSREHFAGGTGSTGAGMRRTAYLLAYENGGMIVAASNDGWTNAIDGNEGSIAMLMGEAVFAFRDERAALFDTFTVLVSAAGDIYLRDFELLAGTSHRRAASNPWRRSIPET